MDRRLILPAAFSLLLTGCGPTKEQNAPEATAMAGNPQVASSAPEINLSAKDRGRVCRAAVAVQMGRSPSIIKVARNSANFVRVQYRRPDDGKIWKLDCRFEGNVVLWRGVDASGPGRWRDKVEDGQMTFEVKKASVTITTDYGDGSGQTEVFKL